jgi:hypothetical protein
VDYAKNVREELDNFTQGSGVVHRVSVLAGRASQVIIEIVPSDDPQKSEIVVTNHDPEWLPPVYPCATIVFESPNKIIVTRPSEYFKQMLSWSNVQAWEDVDFIINYVLTTQP